MNKLIAIALTGLALTAFQSKHIDWKTLLPLVTDRTQVEAIVGPPASGNNNVFTYETLDEKINVWYGGGKLLGKDVCCWKVSDKILFKFVLTPKRMLPLTEMNIDLTAFTKQKAPEMVNDYYYYNENEGLTITTRMVDGVEVLLSIERGPNYAQREGHCRKTNC